MSNQLQELQEALEYQVDVVLRLEDERIVLQKENTLQKEKLKELNQMLQKYLSQQLNQSEKFSQTENFIAETHDTQTQLDDELISDYSLSNSTVTIINQTQMSQMSQSNSSKILDEAKTLVKNQQSKMPIKKLKFCGDNYKENKDFQEQKNVKNNKQVVVKESQTEVLTKEIVNLTKQLQQLKLSQRASQETIKKYEKETSEFMKMLEVKNEMLNKLRSENAEMALIINQDKFKSLRSLDQELKKEKENNAKYQTLFNQKNDECTQLQSDLTQFRDVLTKLTIEFEKYRNNHTQMNTSQSKIEQIDNTFYQEEVKLRDQTIKELKQENEQLQEEVDYFKNMSVQQKKITEKQEEDLDFYREILIKNKIIKQ